MLTSCDDPNTQKQIRRSEQIKKWNERENLLDLHQHQQLILDQSKQYVPRITKVRFPKGCVFLAACSSGDADEVKAHLKIGVNINTTNIDGLTALHQACIDANLDMVSFLVDNNADINSQDNEGWTPLHAAVSVGNLDVSKYLVSKGARLDMCNNDSDLPIDLCDSTNVQMKEWLEEEMQRQSIDAEYERRKEELIMYEDARKMNFEDKIQAKTGATPLHVSAAKGYTRVIRILLQSGADPNAVDKDGWTPLHAAAHWEQEEACRILAEAGADFDAKTYSDQSVFDVCDSEMVAKLKQVQLNVKQNGQKLADLSNSQDTPSITNLTGRGRRSSASNESSIIRLTNEAKSSLSDREKKQEKCLLSPSTTGQFDLSVPNISEQELTTNTNINTSTINPINRDSNHSVNTPNIDTNNDKENRNGTKPTTPAQPPPSKTGLHENLKSLSAHVRLIEEDSPINSTPSDSQPINGLQLANSTGIYKRRLGASTLDETPKAPLVPTSSPPLQSPTHSSSITITNLKNGNANGVQQVMSPLKVNSKLDEGTGVQALTGSPNNADNRRYSSAPIGSKDDQAELIRKQKAKLERHFRRSTTAVSYEDIKSAEATIKGTTRPDSEPSVEPPQQASPAPNGVSSISTLFDKPTQLTTTINLQVSSPPATPPTAATTSYLKLDAPSHQLQHTIANDIETDKLLNVIEKSKGFSDSKSTQARRLRNNSNKTTTPAATDEGPAKITGKVQNLRWNEEKLELEVVRREKELEAERQKTSPPSSYGLKGQNSGPTTLDSSPINEPTISITAATPQSQPVTSRPTYRFGQNDSNPYYITTSTTSAPLSVPSSAPTTTTTTTTAQSNSLNRTNVKRSVSQMPLSERKPLSQSSSYGSTPNNNGKTSPQEQLPSTNFDYQAAYEMMKRENESLTQAVLKLNKDLDEITKMSLSRSDGEFTDKKEKRAADRRISELEEEVKKVENLKQDNNRLKEENAALIRVISKLSK